MHRPHELLLLLSETAADVAVRNCCKCCCQKLLQMYPKQPFCDRMFTCGEKWVCYSNTSSKTAWSETSNIIRRRSSNKNVLLWIEWDYRVIIYKECLKSCQTIESDMYCSMLNNVQAAINDHEKRSMEGRPDVFLSGLFQTIYKYYHILKAVPARVGSNGTSTLQHIDPSDYLFLHLELYFQGQILN